MQINMDSKEVLAKLLAEEDLSVVFRNVRTASFSLQTRTVTLPIMQGSNTIVNWFVSHEISHALFTPDVEYMELARRFGSLPNIVEDVRCNGRIVDRYKGLKRLKKAAYEEMFDNNFYGNENKVVDSSNVNDLPLPDRINIFFKVGEYSGVEFAADEMPIIEMLDGITKWSEVEPVVKAIAKFMKNKQKEEQKEEEQKRQEQEEQEQEQEEGEDEAALIPMFGSDDEETEQDENEDEDSQEDEAMPVSGEDESDEGEDDSGSVSGDSTEGDSETDDESDSDEEDGDLESEADAFASEEDEEGESEEDFEEGGAGAGGPEGEESDEDVSPTDGENGTEESYPDEEDDEDDDEDFFVESETLNNEEDSFADSAVEQTQKDVYRTIRDYTQDWKRWIKSEKNTQDMLGRYTSHWSNENNNMIDEFEKANKKTIEDAAQTFLINRKIDYSSPEMVYHAGVIDTNKLHSYQIDDNIFLRETIVQDNSSKHGVIMFIDFSSSMQQRLFGTVQQAINLAMFAKEAMIPFEVYGFTWTHDRKPESQFATRSEDTINPTDRAANPLFKIFDDQTDTKNFRRTANDLLFFSKWVNSHRHGVRINDFLHSTPLDATLVLAKYIGEDFKGRNGIEKLQMVFLTDGYSDDMNNLPTSYKPEGERFNKPTDLHITDPMLKRTESVQDINQGVTKMLSRNLAEYLDAGVVNFFITDQRMYDCYLTRDTEELVPKAAFNLGEGFGFDESIVVNEKRFIVESVEINVSTSRSAKSSFAKKGRLAKTTRILMNDFAERIA